MIIDVHHHLNRSHTASVGAYLDEMRRTAAEFGVARFCLSGMGDWAHTWTNDEVEQVFRQAPDLVVPLAYLDLDRDPPERVREFADRGFRGLKLIAPVRNYDDPAYFPAYEQATECGLFLLFHTGLVSLLARDGLPPPVFARMRPAYLETIARSFPETMIIGAHLGCPWCEEAGAVMGMNDNVYFDLSGGTVSYQPADFFRHLYPQPFPFERLVFGTDSLARDFAIPYGRQRELFGELGLSAETQHRIFYGNAARVLGLPPEDLPPR